ncbi:MAG: ECF transporter S component [Streptococcaceae bacterium]|jgi:riboflavin transporter FmnP|nr:ECF transporter S component [Streptococcaceae bacterium]
MRQNQTKRIVLVAILSAFSFLLIQFLQFPIGLGGFMKVDPSIVPIMLALYVLGLRGAMSVLLMRSFVYFLFNMGQVSTIIGLPMNMANAALYTLVLWQFAKKVEGFNLQKFVIGGVLGTVAGTLIMLILNYFYAIPAYEHFANFRLSDMGLDLRTWLVVMVLPFNAAQGLVWTAISGLVLVPMKKFMTTQSAKFAA